MKLPYREPFYAVIRDSKLITKDAQRNAEVWRTLEKALDALEEPRETYGSQTRRTLILDSDEYVTVMVALATLVATNSDEGQKSNAHALAARLNAARAWKQRGAGVSMRQVWLADKLRAKAEKNLGREE